MRPLRALVLYLLVIFVGGALLAPWLWHAAHAGGPLLAKAASKPFPRFITNSFLIVAVIGMWPFFRAMGATSRREIGLASPAGHSGKFFTGLLLGLLSLAPVAILALLAGGRIWHEGRTGVEIFSKLTGAIFTAAGVALLEEVLFRGGVFGALRRVFDWRFGLILSAMIYAGAHFLEEVKFVGPVTWSSGFAVLPYMWHGLADLRAVFPGFFTLTLAGMLLALAYHRTGNLYCSIGLHAGWIFWLAVYRLFTKGPAGGNTWFWGTDKMVDGWLAFLVLALTLAAYSRLPMPRKEGTYTWK